MMNKRKNNCGFTLLELVISVSVLVILTGVTAPVFTKYIEKAREQRYITEAKSVFRALQFYLMDLDESGIVISREKLTEILGDYPLSSPRHVLYPYLTNKATKEAYLAGQGFVKDSSAENLRSIEYEVKDYIISVEASGKVKVKKRQKIIIPTKPGDGVSTVDVISTIYDTAVSVWAWLLDHIIFVNLILSIIIVFFRRHDPKTVWTWLLALYFIPVFGILFYLFFDQDFRKSKMFRIKEVEDRLRYSARNQEEFIKSQDMGLLGSLAGGYADLVLYNLEVAGSVLTLNNHVEIFTDGVEKFKDLKEELKNAKRYIHIQYYIIKNDELFDSMIPILLDKVRNGVEVRILYDGMGGRFMPKRKWKMLKEAGIGIASFRRCLAGLTSV